MQQRQERRREKFLGALAKKPLTINNNLLDIALGMTLLCFVPRKFGHKIQSAS